ncbi:MAG: hypothetical protein QXP70_05710 [Methanomassiliicoccales archaeon]
MFSAGASIYEFFRPFGMGGLLLTLFVIFYLDAAVFPTLPEFFTALIFLAHPTFVFALLMLASLSAGEFLGITTLYSAVRYSQIPAWVEKRMRGYSSFFIISDERMILLNRLTPVIPYLGAFIIACRWNYGRSMLFNFVGGLAKYSAIISLASLFLVFFSNQLLADATVLIAVIVLIVVSWSYTFMKRRRTAVKEEGHY